MLRYWLLGLLIAASAVLGGRAFARGVTPAAHPVPTERSEDATYGMREENPIKVGADPASQQFLDSLLGPDGQPVKYKQLGPGRYQVKYRGIAEPVVLYLDASAYEQPKIPVGFTSVASSAVKAYFKSSGYTYPLHVSLHGDAVPFVICPGCPDGRREAPEQLPLLLEGRRFVTTGMSVDSLRQVSGADAFVVSDVYLFEDPPGHAVGLALEISTFVLGGPDRVYGPHSRHETRHGSILERKSILVFEHVADTWNSRGFVF